MLADTIVQLPFTDLTIGTNHYNGILNGGDVTLDAFGIPYGKATVVLGFDPFMDLSDFSPLVQKWATLYAENGTTSRSFVLMLRDRVINQTGFTLTLSLTTDEAVLQDYAVLADDAGAYPLAASLRAVVNYVLGKALPGKALEGAAGGGPNVTPYWDAANYVLNPTLQATGNWFGVNCTVAYSTAGTGSGGSIGYGQGNASTQTNFGVWAQAGGTGSTGIKAVREGDPIVAGVDLRTPDTGVSARIRIAWFGSDDAAIGFSDSAVVALDGTFRSFTVAGTAPKGAVKCGLFVAASAAATGKAIHWDLGYLTEGPFDPGFFSGASPDTAQYDYSYAGANNASQSNRTTLVDAIEPEALVWRAGVTAWDYLTPLLTASGFRLFADEQRRWYLIDPATYSVAGTPTFNTAVITDGSDRISRDDVQVWATGVVVRYVWTNRAGQVVTRTDSAGTAEKVFRIELARPYPGPGMAAKILAGRNGTGRSQDIDAAIDWTVTPGQVATVSMPAVAPASRGISSVVWSLTDPIMRIGTVSVGGHRQAVPGFLPSMGLLGTPGPRGGVRRP